MQVRGMEGAKRGMSLKHLAELYIKQSVTTEEFEEAEPYALLKLEHTTPQIPRSLRRRYLGRLIGEIIIENRLMAYFNAIVQKMEPVAFAN